MGFDINTVSITGKIGRDPELRYTPSKMAVCELSVAVGDAYNGSSSWRAATPAGVMVLALAAHHPEEIAYEERARVRAGRGYRDDS